MNNLILQRPIVVISVLNTTNTAASLVTMLEQEYVIDILENYGHAVDVIGNISCVNIPFEFRNSDADTMIFN